MHYYGLPTGEEAWECVLLLILFAHFIRALELEISDFNMQSINRPQWSEIV